MGHANKTIFIQYGYVQNSFMTIVLLNIHF